MVDTTWHLGFGWSVGNPEYTSREVYSLHARYTHWGRVEKMLFRPTRKEQNYLSLIYDYLIKFFIDLRQVGNDSGFPPPKNDFLDITEILLKVLYGNACTKSGSLRFSKFSGCWLILSVYILMSFDFPFERLFGVR